MPLPPPRSIELTRLGRIVDLLDSRFGLPGTRFRFGLDGLLGLIPGIGDTATMLVSLYVVAEGWRLGVGTGTIMRMLVNVLLDWLIGSVPVAGDLFDFVWKANRRNLGLIERDLARAAGGAHGRNR